FGQQVIGWHVDASGEERAAVFQVQVVEGVGRLAPPTRYGRAEVGLIGAFVFAETHIPVDAEYTVFGLQVGNAWLYLAKVIDQVLNHAFIFFQGLLVHGFIFFKPLAVVIFLQVGKERKYF